MDASDDKLDIRHRAFFSFDPSPFLADLSNIAMDVCADGFDDFERSIFESDLDERSKAALSQVIYHACMLTLESLNRAAANFERYELLTSLHVPPELFVEQPAPVPSEPVDPEQEGQLDQELQGLRERVLQARLANQQLRQQLQLVEKDAGRAAGRAAALKPLAAAVSTTAGPLLEEAAAIGELAAKLRPMVARARQLQARRRADPTSLALAAAAAAGGDASPGGAAAAATAADAAERRARQLMADTGAGLEQLRAANAALQAG